MNQPKTELSLKSYWIQVKNPSYSIFIAFLLLLIYELSVHLYGSQYEYQIRSGADMLIRILLYTLGIHGLFIMNTLIFGLTFALLVYYYRKSKFKIQGSFFLLLVLESFLWAFFFGPLVYFLTGLTLHQIQIASSQAPAQLVISLGAGVYEEIIFRLGLLSLLIWIFNRLVKLQTEFSIAVALIFSSLVFASFHFIGLLGADFNTYSFLFRTVAGCVLGVIFLWRGFAVAALSHTFYNLLLGIGLAQSLGN